MGAVLDCRVGPGTPEHDCSAYPKDSFIPLDTSDSWPVHIYHQYPDPLDT